MYMKLYRTTKCQTCLAVLQLSERCPNGKGPKMLQLNRGRLCQRHVLHAESTQRRYIPVNQGVVAMRKRILVVPGVSIYWSYCIQHTAL